ncbi:MAG: hypothetical protein ACU0C9_04685 [Paracoccaceae bacterium]
MARFGHTPPTNTNPRPHDAADENAELPVDVPSIIPGETTPQVAPDAADLSDTGIPDDLPILPAGPFVAHMPDQADEALEDHNLVLDFF